MSNNRPIIKARRNNNNNHYKDYSRDEYQYYQQYKWNNRPHNHRNGAYQHQNHRKGSKRTREHNDEETSAKRRCLTETNTSTPKNSANKRLQNVVNNLRKSIDSNNKTPVISETLKVTNSNIDNSINDAPKPFITPPTGKKNLASERMKKLRESLELSRNTVDLTESPSPMPVTADEKTQNTSKLEEKPSCSRNLQLQGEVESKNDSIVDRNTLTCSWLNSNARTLNVTNNTEPESSLCVNVNDSVAELHRLQPLDQSEDMEWDASYQNIEQDPFVNRKQSEPVDKIKNLCIVVDTNIFLSNLNKLEEILKMRIESTLQPIIYIPWMVNVELDYIKDQNPNRNLKDSAQSAIRFINSELRQPDSRIKGQTVLEASRQKVIGTSPDDKIIACCFQVKEKYENIILLSNDVNLRNKCLINNIPACSANEARIKIVTLIRKNVNSMKVISKMGFMLSSTIKICAKQKFGNEWNKRDKLNNYPWTMIECTKIMKRYWADLFQYKLLKQCLKTVEQLSGFLASHSFIIDDSKEFEDFMKLCITLCIFMKDLPESASTVESTLKEISSIK